MTAAAGRELHHDHVALIGNLDRLRSIVDALDDATPESGAALIEEATSWFRSRSSRTSATTRAMSIRSSPRF